MDVIENYLFSVAEIENIQLSLICSCSAEFFFFIIPDDCYSFEYF